MTVTIAGNNYLQISSLDTVTTGGTWSGQTPITDAVSYKEGSGSVGFTMKTNGLNTTTFSPSSSVDLSGVKHVRFWMLSTHGGDYSQTELGISDGSNTGYWVLATSSTYPGGWYQCIIDVSRSVDSGTKPTSMNAITSFIIRVTLTGGKNATNFWVDNLIYCDGLQSYGDVAASAYDFEDIYTTGISEDTGVISKFNGVYYLTGSLVFGDTGTAELIFIALSQYAVFVDKSDYVNASLYSITVQGNSTGSTQKFELGEVSGVAGINGCVIVCPNSTLAFDITATDTDVDDFGLYGCTFDTYGLMDFQPNGANLEIIDCNFLNGQGQIQPNTMTFTNNTIVGGISTDGSVLYESTSHNISYTKYINNSRATEFPTAGTYDMTGDRFTGGTYDIHFSASTGNLTIDAGGSPRADPNSGQVENDSSGTVTINNSVTLNIYVKTTVGGNIEGARVYLKATAVGDYPYQDSVTIVSTGTTATVTHTSHGLVTNELVYITGANEWQYNGVFQITVTGTHTYTYTMAGDPVDTATGTITSTFVLMQELTIASGLATQPMRYLASDQGFSGYARKSTSTPLYKTGILTGTVELADYTATIILTEDE